MMLIHVSDLHGKEIKYRKLANYIQEAKPNFVFITGDILPNYYISNVNEFIRDFLKPLFSKLKDELGTLYPDIFLITGNDDAAIGCEYLEQLESAELIYFANNRIINIKDYIICGYPYVPPTPFLLKDWEKYDISRYVPKDSISPEEGLRTIEIPLNIIKYSTIKNDLDDIAVSIIDFSKTIILFHSPPYETNLDKIYSKDINGDKEIISVGSIAIRKFIEKNQPYLTLHGHIHESSKITGKWSDKINKTYCFNASNGGSSLAIIKSEIENLSTAERKII
jgi:Icc-related predicted phosphoesterase